MPLAWKPNENPYRLTYFSLLELGPLALPGVINATAKKIAAKIKARPYIVGGRQVTEAELAEAASRLLKDEERAWETLLVHPVPGEDSKRLRQICDEIKAEASPLPTSQTLHLVNLKGLAPFLPAPLADDIALPRWEELGIPGPESPEDRLLDVQFDL